MWGEPHVPAPGDSGWNPKGNILPINVFKPKAIRHPMGDELIEGYPIFSFFYKIHG
jgi:hypothetical protein